MPRRNHRIARQQRSKRARRARREAHFAGLPGWVGHPSHVAWRKNRSGRGVYSRLRPLRIVIHV